jgi:hypothetical protein
MQAHDRGDGTLVVTYDGTSLTKLLFVIALILLGTATYDVLIGSRGTDRLIGLVGASATCVLAGLASLEQCRFAFDPSTRTIVWRRRWGFRQRSGSIPFDSVREVALQRPIGDEGVPSRRIALLFHDAREVPVTVGYRPDAHDEILKIAALIRTRLGQPPGGSPSESLQALVNAGQTIEAIKRLREDEGLSLSDAKRRVDAIREKKRPARAVSRPPRPA